MRHLTQAREVFAIEIAALKSVRARLDSAFGLAVETRRLASGLVSPWMARFAGALVLAFGGFAWSAGSGMEIVPFAWLLVRAARLAADLAEREPQRAAARARGAGQLCCRPSRLHLPLHLCPPTFHEHQPN